MQWNATHFKEEGKGRRRREEAGGRTTPEGAENPDMDTNPDLEMQVGRDDW